MRKIHKAGGYDQYTEEFRMFYQFMEDASALFGMEPGAFYEKLIMRDLTPEELDRLDKLLRLLEDVESFIAPDEVKAWVQETRTYVF